MVAIKFIINKKIVFIFLKLLCFILILLSASVVKDVTADDKTTTPKRFYQDNFSKKTVDVEVNSLKHDDKKKKETKSHIIKTNKEALTKTPDEDIAKQEVKVKAQVNTLSTTKPLKILAIGAVINMINQEHFAAKLKELLHVLKKHDLHAQTVFGIGLLQNFDHLNDIVALGLRGGSLRVRASAPDPYKITHSPAWLVETEEGVVVLEGVKSLSSYINQYGELVL